jgi:hypothetical protein
MTTARRFGQTGLETTLTEPPIMGELVTTTADLVSVGRQAWGRIKTNAKMMREDWRMVGEALLVGRIKFTTAGGGLNKKGFGQWCRENGFGDIDRRVRTDAIWLAEEWDSNAHGVDISSDVCHPTHIRIAYNELTAETTEPTTPLALPEPVEAAEPVKVPQTKPEPAKPENDTPPWDDEPDADPVQATASVTEEDVEDEPPASGWGALNKLRNVELEEAWEKVGSLIGIKAPKSGDFFIENFLKSIEPDYFVALARDVMIERLRQNDDVETAVDAGADALRAGEDALVEKIRQAVEDAAMEGMSRFLTQVANNKVLSGGNLNKKLLALALDERANPNERINAADKLIAIGSSRAGQGSGPGQAAQVKPPSIFDNRMDEDTKLRLQIGELIGVTCENLGDLFVDDFKKYAKPDYLVGVARTKLIEELRTGSGTEQALVAARRSIRDEEDRIREDVEEALFQMGQEAMKSFVRQTDSNKLLNDPTCGKLLQRALDYRSSSTEERRTALKVLQARR